MNHAAVRTSAIALTAALLLGGCGGINKSATLVNIDKGKDTISLGYGNFAARYTQCSYDGAYRGYFGDDYWSQDMYGDGKTMQTTVKKEVMDQMEEFYLAKKNAADYGVKLTKDQEKDIDKAAKKFIKDNEEDAINQMGATEEYAHDYMEYETYGTLVRNKIREEADVKLDKKEYEESTISYVSFSMSPDADEDSSASSQAEKAEDTSKADKEAAKKSAASVSTAKDFDAEVTAQGGTVETTSYVIQGDSADEDLDESVIDAAKKLKEGKVSAPIEVEDDAYYVVRKDKQLDKDASANKKQELEDQKRTDHYDDTLKKWKKEIDWSVDKKLWKKVKFDTLFEAPKQEESTGETEEDVAVDETTDEAAE